MKKLIGNRVVEIKKKGNTRIAKKLRNKQNIKENKTKI